MVARFIGGAMRVPFLTLANAVNTKGKTTFTILTCPLRFFAFLCSVAASSALLKAFPILTSWPKVAFSLVEPLSYPVHFVMCLSQPIKSVLLPSFPLPLTSHFSNDLWRFRFCITCEFEDQSPIYPAWQAFHVERVGSAFIVSGGLPQTR
jgi:hypothetical protein